MFLTRILISGWNIPFFSEGSVLLHVSFISQWIKMKECLVKFSNRIITEAISFTLCIFSPPPKKNKKIQLRPVISPMQAADCSHVAEDRAAKAMHINASHAYVCVFHDNARCVNDCSHGNLFPFCVKDVEGKSQQGREGRK